jgi:hypothetical protein
VGEIYLEDLVCRQVPQQCSLQVWVTCLRLDICVRFSAVVGDWRSRVLTTIGVDDGVDIERRAKST